MLRLTFLLTLLLGLPGVGRTGAAERDAALPAATVDNSLYAGLLHEHVRDGLVDYAALKTDDRLPAYLAVLEAVDPASLPRVERLAYWINTYNAVTLRLMADHWPVASIMKINAGKPWDLPLFQPRGSDSRLTLNHIEHEIIRKKFREPRIHFVLVCAAISCPPLRAEPYDPVRLSAQLAEQTTAFVRDPARNRYDQAAHTLRLSPLFDWYAMDFGGAAGTPGFVAKYLAPEDQAALARHSREPALAFGDYDWAPNARPGR